MGNSKFFGERGPNNPHLVRGRGGLKGEVYDLRQDIDAAFVAMEGETVLLHKPTITPSRSETTPSGGPTPLVLGTVMGYMFDIVTDDVHRDMKIDSTFVIGGAGPAGDGTNASFHIHWTKSDPLNESGNTVRWRISYTVFNGGGGLIAGAGVTPVVLEFDDTYDDAGTTDYVVHRTASVPAPGFIPGYYVGITLDYVDAATTVNNPVLISGDLVYRNYVNKNPA